MLLKEGNPRRCISVPGCLTAILRARCWKSRTKSQIMLLKIISSGFINVGQYCTPGFPSGSAGKKSTYNAGATGDVSSIPGSGRSPEVGNGNPLQYSCLGNSMDRAWWATVHGVVRHDLTCTHELLFQFQSTNLQ